MTVLVTGSTGMLGRVLCGAIKKDHSVLGVSRQGPSTGSGLGAEHIRCELSDLSAIRRVVEENSVGLVVNTAAFSDVDGCERDPKLAYASNALSVKNLATVCSAKNIPWVHVSTDYVFDGDKREPYKEEDKVSPKSNYGLTKLMGEWYAMNSASPCAIVRTSWLFGPGNPKTFVNWVSARLKAEGTVSVLDNQTTSPTSIKDLSEAILKILRSLADTKGKQRNQVFHVCNRGGTTHKGIAEFIRDNKFQKATIQKIDLSAFPNRPAIRPKRSVMDPEKFEKAFGVTMRPWQESLKEYIQACEF